MTNLWLRELADADVVLEGKSDAERVRIMVEAMDHAMFRSLTPLSEIVSPQARRLVEEAIATGRTAGSGARAGELSGRIYPLLNAEASVASIMLAAGLDLLSAVSEGARVSETSNVLFQCYDATMQRQGFGRNITLEDQLGSPACLDVIREHKELLATT